MVGNPEDRFSRITADIDIHFAEVRYFALKIPDM